jgi:hypothetical protein
MRKLILLIASFVLITFISCAKRDYKSVTVVRHCTGPYLKIDGLEYLVCNPKMIESVKDGEQVMADYSFSDECLYDGIQCAMVYESAGWVRVNKIKKNR